MFYRLFILCCLLMLPSIGVAAFTPEVSLPTNNHQNQYFSSGVSYGLFYGFMLALLAINGIFFLMNKNRTFLYYAFFLIFSLLLTLSLETSNSGYLSHSWQWLKQDGSASFILAMAAFNLLFVNQLIGLTAWVKTHRQVLTYSVPIMFLMTLLVLPLAVEIGILVATGFAFISLFYLLVVLFKSGLRCQDATQVKMTQHYLLTLFISLSISIGVYATASTLSAISAVITGVFSYSVLLMLVLGYGYRKAQLTQQKSQAEALLQAEQAAIAQQALLDLQQSQQDELEVKVQERTFELEVTLRELEEKNQALEEKSTLDSLTGLRNRSYFDKKLLAEYRRSRREQTVLSLIMFDIDHFKQVNDNHGHPAGDDVIRVVASLAQQVAKRPTDIVCRYGGEEFSIILPSTDSKGAFLIAEKLRMAIAAHPIHTCDGPIEVRVSFGLASLIGKRETSEMSLLKLADEALYKAKNNGRNQVWLSEKANIEID